MIAINTIVGQQVQAAGTDDVQEKAEQKYDDKVLQLNTIVVTATYDEKKTIGKVTSGVNKEDIERRGATNVVDLLNQISNVSLNGLYARPDVSVAIQGIGGRGRVNQSLEGIQQSFEAFTHNFNQSGTILINPAFLSSIDVTQGATSDAGSIGNLAGSANFNYVNVDDVLSPEQDIGGIFRLQNGIGEWSNGQNLTRTGLFAARGDQWELLLGASKGSNDNYHMGKNVSRDDFLKYTNSNWGGLAYAEREPTDNNTNTWGGATSFDYNNVDSWIHRTTGGSVGSPIAFAAQDSIILDGMQSAAPNSVYPGTFRETEGYLLKAKYLFNDEYNQSLALFATKTEAHSQSDVTVDLRIPTITGGSAYFLSPSYYVDNLTQAQVYSLKYNANFSNLINPNFTVFHQRMKRTQLWPNEGFYIPVEDLKNYSSYMDTKSTGINLGNSSHFNTAWLGALTLNTALQYKHDKHVPKDFTQNEAMVYGTILQTGSYLGKWNPDSKTDSLAFSFDLNNHESDSPWKWNIGAGIQNVKTQVIDAVIETGNIAKEGTVYSYLAFQPEHITASSSAVRRNWRNGIIDPSDTLALAAYQAWQNHLVEDEIRYDSSTAYGNYIFLSGQNPKHTWNLKAGNLSLQYTFPDTGLSFYGQAAYGERAPTSTEMYMYGNYYKSHIIQSRFLKPESNLSLQLGLNYIKEGLFTDEDSFDLNAHLYQNKIDNYILMAYHQNADTLPSSGYDYAETANGVNPYRLGYEGYTNNTTDWVTRGLGLNFAYKQPTFYLRGNLTVPFEKKNQYCWDEFQGGNGYYSSYDATIYGTVYSSAGTGRHVCGNPYKWFMYQTLDPIQASLTAAITPFDGKLELGTTLNYRAKQRSYFYVDAGATDTSGNSPYGLGDWGEWNRFPAVLKVDLFASYKFSDQLKARLYLANATDQMDIIPWGEYADIMPGRTLTASVEYRHGDGRNIFGSSRLSEDYNWTGWHQGIGISDNKFKLNTDSLGLVDGDTTAESGLFDAKTTRYDLHLGYDLQLKDSPWVIGVEAGISDSASGGISRGDTTQYTYVARANNNSYSIPTASVQYDFDLGASLRGRIGYAAGRTLFYGFAGTTLQKLEQKRTQYQMSAASQNDIYGTKIDPTSQAMFSESDSDTLFGWNVGLGVEHTLTNNLSLRTEYNYADLGSVNSQFDHARADASIGYQQTIREQVQVGTFPNGLPRYEWQTRVEDVAGGYDTVNGRKNSTDIKKHNFGLSLNWRF